MKSKQTAQQPNNTFEVYGVEKFKADIESDFQGLMTGYHGLDKIIRIPPGAITIIAGRTSHGKTVFQLNLLLKFMENPLLIGKTFYFISYEESRCNIAINLIMMMAGDVLDTVKNRDAYLGYLKGSFAKRIKNNENIEQAIKKFHKFTASKRLFIIDQADDVSNLESKISAIDGNKTGAIFVDYIQKITVSGSPQWARYQEIKTVSQILLELAKTKNIPIIMGAQFGRPVSKKAKIKLSELRESGDIEQDANLVLGIYNKSVEQLLEENNDQSGKKKQQKIDKIVSLEVFILKNRNGPTGDSITLDFTPQNLRISDPVGPF
jgi:replicative DNA helicase